MENCFESDTCITTGKSKKTKLLRPVLKKYEE